MTANPEARRFRIAMVVACAFPANHGTPAAIREICETLVQMGHEVHIVTYPLFEDHIPLDPRVHLHRPLPARCDIIPVGPSLRRVGYDLMLPRTLVQVVRRHRCQVIHVHNYEGLLVGILGKLFTGKPLIYNAINTMSDELPSYGVIRPRFLAVGLARLLDRFPPRAADHVIANTLELKEFLIRQGVPPERITPVPTAIDASFFAGGDRRRVRDRYSLGDRPVVIYTGTFDFFQGLDLLLQAFREVKSRLPDAALLLLGSTVMPEHRRVLEAQAQELGISQDIIFAEAPFAELPHFLAAADVGVVARPISKGMPVKILNYLAAGLPMVSFQGSAEFMAHRQDAAVLVPGGDWRDLAAGLLRVLQDRDFARDLGRRGREFVLSEYDCQAACRKLLRVYDRLAPED